MARLSLRYVRATLNADDLAGAEIISDPSWIYGHGPDDRHYEVLVSLPVLKTQLFLDCRDLAVLLFPDPA